MKQLPRVIDHYHHLLSRVYIDPFHHHWLLHEKQNSLVVRNEWLVPTRIKWPGRESCYRENETKCHCPSISGSGMQSHLELDEKNTTKTTVMTHESSSSTLSWVSGLSLSSFSCIITFSLSVCGLLTACCPSLLKWDEKLSGRHFLTSDGKRSRTKTNTHIKNCHQNYILWTENQQEDWLRHGCCFSRSSPGGYCIWP